MKVLLAIVCGLFLFAILCVVFSTLDNVPQTEDDLKKYDEMTAFFDTGCVFISGTLNLDTSVMRCTFKMVNPQETLIDALIKNQWNVTQRQDNKITLQKKSTRKTDTLTLTFNPDNTCIVGWK